MEGDTAWWQVRLEAYANEELVARMGAKPFSLRIRNFKRTEENSASLTFQNGLTKLENDNTLSSTPANPKRNKVFDFTS